MDSRSGLVTFGLFVLLFVFILVFSINADEVGNAAFGVLALIGYVFSIGASVYNGILARREGSALEAWFKIYAAVVFVAFLWFLTRTGNIFG